ncbi:heme-binding protein [Sphingomonas sp. HDW15A]|uniref:SOUL family heme-binding protein n=1 Tax=Sphingomonas sp. HDW15A TaxID=2714942 RepID=UPI00140721D1|nr:heme-binding protein [Sphingomonas sp. HDW15A]QIK95886.1 heme-binding protein [Sphingomonas sp. HDW15A]
MRKTTLAGAALGATLLGGAAIYYFREKATPGPEYRVLMSDGDFEIRDYPSITVAETVVRGPRKDALSEGFRVLADYIFAKSRGGEALPMTVPVLQDAGDPMGSDPPLFDDAVEGGWRMRFVMPEGRTVGDLPEAPQGVALVEVPARRVAAVKFAGVADDARLAEHENLLRGWLAKRDERGDAEAEFAFYNSPMIPPPLRRSEVLIPLR